MVHNGIGKDLATNGKCTTSDHGAVSCLLEQGILSAICESYALFRHTLGFSNGEIANIFKSWNSAGALKNCFLVDIGEKALRFKRGDGIEDKAGIIDDIKDKVVQDVDASEGTGVWTAKVSLLA